MNLFVLSALVLLGGLVLQAASARVPLIYFKMDVGWLIVVFLGFFGSLGRGGAAVFVIGLAQEALGGTVRGVLPISYLTVFFLLRLSHQHLFYQGGTSQAIWVVILTALQKALEAFLLQAAGYEIPYRTSWDWLAIGGIALVQGFCSLLIFPLLRKGVVEAKERY